MPTQNFLNELDLFLDFLKTLTTELKKATKIPKEQREKMRNAISETCDLIDALLSIVRYEISSITQELKSENLNLGSIERKIYNLADESNWRKHYRHFQMCEPLRTASSELRGSLFSRIKDKFIFDNRKKLDEIIRDYIDGETKAARFISDLLQDLSQLGVKVYGNPKKVLKKLEEAKLIIDNFRESFIEIEKQILDTI